MFLQVKRVEDDTSWVTVEKKPVGVIAGFVPWNAPIVLMIRKLAPALVCGNTIVIKTPPTTPLGVGTLLKRAADKDDVADQVVTMCRTETMTGQTVAIDSGRIFH